ncbi:DUF4339 domain-containing protein [Gillisia limnaea]|uniref:GYF domain-containing protein n=1 Tax=Gillisia limnaea (strain DSM 15749 / LMG 21470 / R-8282) TaxID=865937 RepID=H2BVR8_GILLR|nr:DUF4339 domain-containing protein [Gillisia limnaea]EHQ04024.1 hypothetical protein Gilli_3424 [Gillisia limnaea DSM 15749]
MDNYYYYIKEGEKIGPYTTYEIKNRNLPNDTLVWKEGMNSWTELQNISEFSMNSEEIPPPIPVTNNDLKANPIQKPPDNYVKHIVTAIVVGFATKFLIYQWYLENYDGHYVSQVANSRSYFIGIALFFVSLIVTKKILKVFIN